MSVDNTPAPTSTAADPSGGDPGPSRGSEMLKSALFAGASSSTMSPDAELVAAAKLLDQPPEPAPMAEPLEAAPASADVKSEGVSEPPAAPAEPVSRGWAAIKEAEKQLRTQRDQLKQQAQEFQQQRQELERLQQQNNDVATALRQDPFGTLQKLGVPFEYLADLAIKGTATAPEPHTDAPKSELEELRNAVKALREERENERKASEGQRLVQEYRNSVEAELSKGNYTLLKAYPAAIDDTMELVSNYARKHQKVLTPEQALGILQDTFRTHVQTLGSNEAVRELFGIKGAQSPSAAPTSVTQSPTAKSTPAASTITQSLVASTPPPREGNYLPRTEAEILAEAMKHVPPDPWKMERYQ